MKLDNKHDIKRARDRIYYHNPYVLKKTAIDVLQFFERYWYYDLYNQEDLSGAAEQFEWERLLFLYLEQLHSYIDLREKIEKKLIKHCDFNSQNFYKFKKRLSDDADIDCVLVRKLRNVMHHETIDITKVCTVVGGRGPNYDAIPIVFWCKSWFENENAKARVGELEREPKLLKDVIENSFTSFANISKQLGKAFDDYLNN